eukprot:NODE_10054_length_1380_cov_3.481245.p1 GENE.NODE_10054_length_1380_cov_3.481245~~NODE_10054_length_1380_cov_3.481245.p1  ORF type:complete len:367 (+),score=85.24 NODE_10054_length_1380_cov_3.481245:252-1352(+)
MEEFGIGGGSQLCRDSRASAREWEKVMEDCLSIPANGLIRANVATLPRARLEPLEPLFTDPPLTHDGKRQLRVAVSAAAATFADLNAIDTLVVSPMLRTLQTAAIVVAGLGLDLAHCRVCLDADAREHNHTAWLDTWGTASLAALRRRAREEISIPTGPAETMLLQLRPSLQLAELRASSDHLVRAQVAALCRGVASATGRRGSAGSGIGRGGSLEAFVAAVNRPTALADSDVAAAAELAAWDALEHADPTFSYRVGGDIGARAPRLTARLSSHIDVRWWAPDESVSQVRDRVRSVLSELGEIRAALVVTHTLFILEAMEVLCDAKSRCLGPAPKPKPGELVANGGIFYVHLDAAGRTVEAGLFEP